MFLFSVLLLLAWSSKYLKDKLLFFVVVVVVVVLHIKPIIRIFTIIYNVLQHSPEC